MSWAAILALAAGTYAMKAAGPILLGGRPLPARLVAVVALLPAAVFAALVLVDTFAEDGELVLDARAAGVGAAAVAAWLKAPFLAVVGVAVVVTALVRALPGA